MQVLNWALLLLATLCPYTAVDASTPDERLEDYFKQKLDDFKIKLHEAFEKARLQRHKRSVMAPDSPDYGVLPQDHLRVIGTKPVDLGIRLGNVSCWEPAYVLGSTFLVVATSTGQVELLRWTNGRYATFAGMATSLTTAKVKLPKGNQDPLLDCLQGLENSLLRRQAHVDHLAANIGRVWTSSGQKPLATELLVIDGPVKVTGSVSAPKAVIMPSAQRVPTVTPADVSRQMDDVRIGVAKMENELKNVVFKSVPQTIQGNLHFDKPVVSSTFNVGQLVDSTLNGVPLVDMLRNSLKVTGDQVLDVPVSFNDLYVNNLNVQTINGINISGVTTVTGEWTFQAPLTVGSALNLKNPINGLYSIRKLYTEAVDKHSHQTIRGPKTYQAPVAIHGNAEVAGTLNGVRPNHDLVTLHTPQNIVGTWIVKDLIHFKRNLNAGTVNGLDIAKDAVLRSKGPQVVFGRKVFDSDLVVSSSHQNAVIHGDVSFPSIVVHRDLHTETVNGKPLAKQFLLLNGEQVMAGIPSFMKPISVKDVVADFVNPVQLNGVPFKAFMDELVLQNSSRHRLISNKHFRNGLEAHHLQSYGFVDGVNIEEMLNSVVLLNVPQVVDGVKVFQNRLRLESLLADQVNGLDIKEHVRRVIRRNVQQVISGKKTVLG
ncbi:hypothetical protein HPB49_025940 [Dermacentor silvarum]|nr:hypothetical protein HPB49_025940 [Dermacentor silvarum]